MKNRYEERFREICGYIAFSDGQECDGFSVDAQSLPSVLDNMFYESFGMSVEDILEEITSIEGNN